VVPVSAVALGLAASLLLAPGVSSAQSMQPAPLSSGPARQAGGARVGGGGQPGAVDRTITHPAPPPAIQRPFHPVGRPFFWATPGWYDSYYAPVYSPPLVIAVGPPGPPIPSVIEYPNGRLEMRGDGITVPYQWVWVPNPPAPPPSAPPPPPAPPAPAAVEPSPSRPTRLYRWVGEDGVVNWTDAWDSIPERYRAQAARKAAG